MHALPHPRQSHPSRVVRRLGLFVTILLLAGCGPRRLPSDWAWLSEITPAFMDSLTASDPVIATDTHGRVAITWVTSDTTGAKDLWLTVSSDSGASFSEPARVNDRPGSVVSYPECRAAVAYGPAGALAIAWTEKRFDVEKATDVVVRASGDGGNTLGSVNWINDDHTKRSAAFHAFPALTFKPDGSLFATWIDEREYAGRNVESMGAGLYYAASFDGGQTWSANDILRDLVCPCCRPSAIASADGEIAVAYRSADLDMRDPALAISTDGGSAFETDTVLYADRWELPGCPADGPAITWNRATGGHYAWFTGAGEAGVYIVPWRPETGAGGVKRAIGDSLYATARPRLAALGEATLIGVEARPAADTTRTVFAVRALDPDGSLTPWLFLGAEARDGWLAASEPRAAYACWIENDERGGRVRVVRLVRR